MFLVRPAAARHGVLCVLLLLLIYPLHLVFHIYASSFLPSRHLMAKTLRTACYYDIA